MNVSMLFQFEHSILLLLISCCRHTKFVLYDFLFPYFFLLYFLMLMQSIASSPEKKSKVTMNVAHAPPHIHTHPNLVTRTETWTML